MPCTAALVSGGPDSAVLVWTLARRGTRVVPIYIRQGLRWEAAEQYWLRRWLAVFPPRGPQSGGGVAPLVTLTAPAADRYRGHWSVTGVGVPGAAAPDAAVELPGRNLVLVTTAAVYCAARRISRIALGTLKGNPFADATPLFRRALGRALTLGLGRPIAVEAPLASIPKAQVLRRAAQWRLPLGLTFSCINPRGRAPCGRCQKCEERRRGFRQAGLHDVV